MLKIITLKKHKLTILLLFCLIVPFSSYNFANSANKELTSEEIQALKNKTIDQSIKNSINSIIIDYEGPNHEKKLEKKWKDAINDLIKNPGEYNRANNYNIIPNVLFHVRSKEKNLEMSYVNPNEVKKKAQVLKKLTEKEKTRLEKETRESIRKFYSAPHIPNCEKSYTKIEANPFKDRYSDVEASKIIFDDLLLSKEVLKYIPANKIINKDYFGDKNIVEYYSEEFLDFFSLRLKDSNIECLPFRLIVTKNNFIKHYGVNALKNYDFKKEGELNYNVSKNLSIFLLNQKI